MVKNISNSKLAANYGSNSGEKSTALDGVNKDEILNRIKNQELEKLMGGKSENKDAKEKNEFLKRKLDALKNKKA